MIYSPVLIFSVGGTQYATSLRTLTYLSGTYFSEKIKFSMNPNDGSRARSSVNVNDDDISDDVCEKCSNVVVDLPVDKEGLFVIDRSGPLFEYVLEYLRDPERFIPPKNKETRTRLKAESIFYRLIGLTTLLNELEEVYMTITGDYDEFHRELDKVATDWEPVGM